MVGGFENSPHNITLESSKLYRKRHAQYVPEAHIHDIALLRLNEPVTQSRVLPLCSKSHLWSPLFTCGFVEDETKVYDPG